MPGTFDSYCLCEYGSSPHGLFIHRWGEGGWGGEERRGEGIGRGKGKKEKKERESKIRRASKRSIHETDQVQAAITTLHSSKKTSLLPHKRFCSNSPEGRTSNHKSIILRNQHFTIQHLNLCFKAQALHMQTMLLAEELGGSTVFEVCSQVVCANGNSHFRGRV